MAFIQKQGYWRSENGWRMCDSAELDFSPVPVIGWKVGVRVGVPNTLLKALMVRLHREVEPIDINQCGVFTATNSMGNSNHNSGTALDYNWNKHPFHALGTWGANKVKVERILNDFRGTIEWGGHWTDPLDEMHFELHYGEGHQGSIDLANELYQGGLWGIFKPGTQPTNPPIDEDYLERGDTGDDVLVLQQELNRVFPRYKTTPVPTDRTFGPETEAAVREFQERADIGVDGIVGPETRAALKANGVNLDRKPTPVVVPPWPQSAKDRELLEYIADQLGPGHPTWESKGMTLRDKLWTLASDDA